MGRYLYQLWSVDCIIVCIPNQIKLEFELSGCTRVVLISLSIISFEGEKLSLDISSRLKTSNLLPAFYLYKIKDLSNELHLIYLESLHSLRWEHSSNLLAELELLWNSNLYSRNIPYLGHSHDSQMQFPQDQYLI